MREFFKVGKIVNTHGLKGEVKVMATTSDVNNFKRYESIFIDGEEREILGVKFQKDRVILKIEGIDSIDEAEKYKNKIIEVPRDKEPELPEDTFYAKDLIGIHVFDTDGKDLGPVYEVIETKNNDVYWIKEPKELLIPVLKTIVTDIDLDAKKIIIRPVGEWSYED